MPIAENKKIASAVLNALSQRDWKTLKSAFAEDAILWVAGSLPLQSGTHTIDFVRRLSARLPVAFPDGMSLTAKAMTAEGNRVAIEAESLGNHVSGKTYNNHFHLLMVIRDGLVHEWKEYMDTMHAYEVLAGGKG